MRPFCSIIPSHMFQEIAQRGTPGQRASAWRTLSFSERLRGERSVFTLLPSLAVSAGQKRRTIYDAQNQWQLPGKLVRGEGDPKSRSKTVNEAHQGADLTYDFFKKVFGRNSLDDRGMRLDSSVHYGRNYDNAFWNGHQMVYGDGDGYLFQCFTKSLDVIGHELTHGVVQ